MRHLRVVLWLTLILATIGMPAFGQDVGAEYATESRLLEADLDRYIEARGRESEAIGRVREMARQVDEALADPNAPVAELRSLEASFASTRDTAFARLGESAEARIRMYDRMDRLAMLARQLEDRPPAPVKADEEGPNGLWEFEFESAGIYALVDLKFEVSGFDRNFIATGTYRTSNGHRGTLVGTFTGTRMALEVLDSRRGKVASVDGTVGADGRLNGTWQAVTTGLDSNRPQGGLWSGHRISSESDVSFD
jgi:hypothetical protein